MPSKTLALSVAAMIVMVSAPFAQEGEVQRAIVTAVPYDGPAWNQPGLFAYQLKWQTQSSDAVQAIQRLYPDVPNSVAVTDLDGDGVGELVVRFADQCLAGTMDDDSPTCAYAVLGWNGDDWQVLMTRYAATAFEVRNAAGDVGIGLDGVAFTISGLGASLMSPSIISWGNPIEDEGISRVRMQVGAPASIPAGDLFVAEISVPGREKALVFARSVAPFYNWQVTSADFAPLANGRSSVLPSAVLLPNGMVELVGVEDDRFASSKIELPVATDSFFSFIENVVLPR